MSFSVWSGLGWFQDADRDAFDHVFYRAAIPQHVGSLEVGRQSLDARPFLDDGDHIIPNRLADRGGDVDGWAVLDAASFGSDVGNDLVERREKVFASAGGDFDGRKDVDHGSWTLFRGVRFMKTPAARAGLFSDLR